MAEILTESFCERCGTRYTFESPARRSSPLGALETVGRGLRNFVASPDQSIDEAFAVARAESEQRATAHQLEAFHRTFNFCLSCRQYTCAECWNPVDGRCQSCSPITGHEAHRQASPEALTAAETMADAPVVFEAIAIARAAAAPVIEPPEETFAEPEAVVAEPEPVVAEPEVEVEPEITPEPIAAEEATAEVAAPPEPAPEPVAEPPASAQPARPGSLPSLPPGVSLDEEIAAYDLRMAALAAPPPPAPTIQPIAASATPMGQAPAAMPAPRIVPAVVPDLPAASEAAMPAAQAATSCPSCGLALSATARFCRRCGTSQQHGAVSA